MMDKVWIFMIGEQYEGELIENVYSSEELAEKAVQNYIDRDSRTWTKIYSDYWKSEYGSYIRIEEYEVL